MPRPGIWSRRSGEDLFSPEELACQEAAGPNYQQQSQAAGSVLLYPLVVHMASIVNTVLTFSNSVGYKVHKNVACMPSLYTFCVL